jgi:hypothetical protein
MKKYTLFSLILGASVQLNAQYWDVTDPKKLSGGVNSAAEENMPVFSKDSSQLYFVRTYDANNTDGEMDQDIWYSSRNSDGSFGEAKNLKALNNKFNNAVFGVSNDGNRLYLINAYEGKKDMEKGCAVSERKGDSWSNPTKVNIPNLKIMGDFYGFHVNGSEDVMIISHAGPGTLGKEDLYVSVKKGGAWSELQHMGNNINTSGFEISPFLTPGGDTLFFSSNGHGGEGDADIFFSVKQGSWTNWSKPVNLGPKINSPKFDAYFVTSGNDLYWSSNRDSERSNIYHARVMTPPAPSVACKGTNVSVFGGSDGKIVATVDGGVAPLSYSWSNGMTVQNPEGLKKGEYTLTVTDKLGQTATCTVTITEPAAPQDIAFKHYFDYNADKLTIEEGKLNQFVTQVADLLNKGRAEVTIEIQSSASKVPTSTFGSNDRLAKSRADKMKKELEGYFAKAGLKDKVNVVVTGAVVSGPDYAQDPENRDKYRDYQFIELKTK